MYIKIVKTDIDKFINSIRGFGYVNRICYQVIKTFRNILQYRCYKIRLNTIQQTHIVHCCDYIYNNSYHRRRILPLS